MVLAIAVLLFQISPVTQVLPPTSVDVEPLTSAPRLLAANLPDADVVSNAARLVTAPTVSGAVQPHDSAAVTGASGESRSADSNPVSLHAALENSRSLSMIRVPESDSTPARFISAESLPSRRKWIALSIAQHAAAAFDAYSTRDAISHGAVEQDPLMRPFANSSAVYAAIQACPVALDFAARHMQRSENIFLRRTWWVPQSVSAGMYLFSGVHNIHVADRP
ncbi:MAG: hypothetical protein ABSA57_00645 [Candidatus Acidiferrales bacterium]|jgi:hypothetical protein